MTREEEIKFWKKLTKEQLKYEAFMFRSMQKYFRKVSDNVIALIDESGDIIEEVNISEESTDLAFLLFLYAGMYEYVGKASFINSYRDFKKQLGSSSPDNFANALWIKKLSEVINGVEVIKRTNSVIETTKERIRKILADGKEKNLTVKKLKTFVRKNLLGNYARNRSKLISRTESTFLTGLAEEESAIYVSQELGFDLEKKWVKTFDDRLRDTHRNVTNEYIPASMKFKVSSYLASRPGDPILPVSESINCRCKCHYRKRGGGFI